MSVIVKDIDMPLGCCYEDYDGKTGYCPFCNHDDVPYCILEPTHMVTEELLFISVDSRPDGCPLVDVPDRNVGEWIPCSERLPEEHVDVLCCFTSHGKNRIRVSYRMDYNYWNEVGRTGDMVAWMPLPEPWKGDF